MNEKKFLKKIKSKNNRAGDALGENTPLIVMEFLDQDKLAKPNFINRVFRKLFNKKRFKSHKEIVSENFETIIDTLRDLSDDGNLDMDRVLDFCDILCSEDNKDIVLENIDKIYPKIQDGRDIFALVQFEKKIGKEIDSAKEELLCKNKIEIAKYIIADSNTDLGYADIEEYAKTLDIIIDELLDSEKCKYLDVTSFKRGGYSQVFQIGNKILKIGKPRETYNIPNHKRLLQPLTRTNLLDKYNEPRACIEIQERVDPPGEVSDEVLYAIYKELRDDGIIWTDAKASNLGRLRRNNVPTLNGKEMDVAPNSVGFTNEKNKKDLMSGELVVIDLDFIYKENDPDIRWPIFSLSESFEKRYQQEKANEIAKEYMENQIKQGIIKKEYQKFSDFYDDRT